MLQFELIGALLIVSSFCINSVNSVEEIDQTNDTDRKMVPSAAHVPGNDVLLSLYLSKKADKFTSYLELTRRQINEFYGCVCDLENKECNIMQKNVENLKIDSEEWKTSFFTDEYFCEPYVSKNVLLSCIRLETILSSSNCDRKTKLLCSPFLRSHCSLFPSSLVTIFLSTQLNISFSIWSNKLDDRFIRVDREDRKQSVTENTQTSEGESNELSALTWVLITIIVFLLVLVVLMIVWHVISRRRRQQKGVPRRIEQVSNIRGNVAQNHHVPNANETNEDYETINVDLSRSFTRNPISRPTDSPQHEGLVPTVYGVINSQACEMSENEAGSTTLDVLTSPTQAVPKEPAYVNEGQGQTDVGRSCRNDYASETEYTLTFKELLAKEAASYV